MNPAALQRPAFSYRTALVSLVVGALSWPALSTADIIVSSAAVVGTQCARSSTSGTFKGTWSAATKTCTLTGDVTENIRIITRDTSLDCNRRKVTNATITAGAMGTVSDSQIYVRNCVITGGGIIMSCVGSGARGASGNTISSCGAGRAAISAGRLSRITSNAISGCDIGVRVAPGCGSKQGSIVSANTISNCSSATGTGVAVGATHTTFVADNLINNCPIGISLTGSGGGGFTNILRENFVRNSRTTGLRVSGLGGTDIFNNWFANTTNMTHDSGFNPRLTIPKRNLINIAGGPMLGGNFWTNPAGTGFSHTCTDADKDGFCDKTHSLPGVSGRAAKIDTLPLSNFRPIAVALVELSATRGPAGVRVAWQTASELSCGAFAVMRCAGHGCDVHAPIANVACENRPDGARYHVIDANVHAGEAFSYLLREHETTGGINDYGPVRLASGQAHASWSPRTVAPRDPAPPSTAIGCSTGGAPGSPTALMLVLLVVGAVGARRRR